MRIESITRGDLFGRLGSLFRTVFFVVVGLSSLKSLANECSQSFLIDEVREGVPTRTFFGLALVADFAEALKTHGDPRFLKIRSPEDLQLIVDRGGQLFLNAQGNVGFGVTKEGELISLFNQSGRNGIGRGAVHVAIAHGARFLYCLEPRKKFFESTGFQVTQRLSADSIDPARAELWGENPPNRLKMELP